MLRLFYRKLKNLIVVALLGGICWGAVTKDAVSPSSTGATSAAAATLSWASTCNSCTDIVAIGQVVKSPDTGLAATATYNGTAMTSCGVVHANNSTGGFVQMWKIHAPTTGTQTIVITVSGGTPQNLIGGSISFLGSSAGGVVCGSFTAFGVGTGPSLVVTGATANDLVVDGECNGTNIPVTTKTAGWSKAVTNSTQSGNGGQSTATGAASVTMGYTTSSDSWGMIGAIVQATTPSTHCNSCDMSGKVFGEYSVVFLGAE